MAAAYLPGTRVLTFVCRLLRVTLHKPFFPSPDTFCSVALRHAPRRGCRARLPWAAGVAHAALGIPDSGAVTPQRLGGAHGRAACVYRAASRETRYHAAMRRVSGKERVVTAPTRAPLPQHRPGAGPAAGPR